MLWFIFWFIFSIFFCIYLYLVAEKSGLWKKVQPEVTESPKNLSKSLTVLYKYHLGAYSSAMNIIDDARHLFAKPKSVTAFGIYYDDASRVDARFCQSAVGFVVGVNDKQLYDEEVIKALSESGFEKMVLPTSARAVQAFQPTTHAYSAMTMLVYRTYGIIRNYIATHRLDVKCAVEFYTRSGISVEFPLDNADEFLVPDYLPTVELESKLASKKFDSDEEDSESEPENDEQESMSE